MRRILRMLCLGTVLSGCGDLEGDATLTRSAAEKSPERVVLAQVGRTRYTLADLAGRIARRGTFAQERYQAPQAKLAFVESLVDFEVLAREAALRGHLHTPEVARAQSAALARVLWQRGELPGAAREALTEERLRDYHARHRAEFLEPETARVSQILIALPEGRPLEAREKARRKAEEVLRALGSAPDAQRFAAVARQHSEDAATREKGGDLGLLAREADDSSVPAEVVEAAFALKRVGQISRPVESAQGVHILRLTETFARRPAALRNVRKKVEARLWSEMRREAMRRLIASLREKARIRVDPEQARALGESSRYLR